MAALIFLNFAPKIFPSKLKPRVGANFKNACFTLDFLSSHVISRILELRIAPITSKSEFTIDQFYELVKIVDPITFPIF
jgi:hypothetical protein